MSYQRFVSGMFGFGVGLIILPAMAAIRWGFALILDNLSTPLTMGYALLILGATGATIGALVTVNLKFHRKQ